MHFYFHSSVGEIQPSLHSLSKVWNHSRNENFYEIKIERPWNALAMKRIKQHFGNAQIG